MKNRLESICLAVIIINSNLMVQDSLPGLLQMFHALVNFGFFVALIFGGKK